MTTAQRGLNSPFEEIIAGASSRYGVEIALIKAVISKESNWNPSASSSSSHGLMQLNSTYFHNADGSPIFDPYQNIDIGTSLLAEQIGRRGGDLALVLAAYNAGTSRSDADLASRIANNILGVGDYVSDVLNYRDWFLANDPASGGVPGTTNGIGTDGGGSNLGVMLAVGFGLLLVFAATR